MSSKSRYTYLRNPVTGDCAIVSQHTTIAMLRRYDWEYITRLEYKTWQVANVKADRAMRAGVDAVRH